MTGRHRRTFLRSTLAGTLPLLAGCSLISQPADLNLRMVRITNLANEELQIRMFVSPPKDNASHGMLYYGPIGVRDSENDNDAGEITLTPERIDSPLSFGFRLSVVDGADAELSSEKLRSAFRSSSSEQDPNCIELEFTIRNPYSETGVQGDTAFWKDCASAPGTVTSSR